MENPLHVIEHESILRDDAWTFLTNNQTNNQSVDALELFGGTCGVTRLAVRRKLITKPILDLVYGCDLSDQKNANDDLLTCEIFNPK